MPRVITGLNKGEFASTVLVAEPLGLKGLPVAKVDSMERHGTAATADQARIAAETFHQIMDGSLFGTPAGTLRTKQNKPDTKHGWPTVRSFAAAGVPYGVFLHQRHYGGAFGQHLNATSELRGNLIEDAVEALFVANAVPHIRTGSHNQALIATQFEVTVWPAPDFVVYDHSDTLRALLEYKGANDGSTARDKALRFERLRTEANRLGGIPLIAVLGGLGWTRVNDTLGPLCPGLRRSSLSGESARDGHRCPLPDALMSAGPTGSAGPADGWERLACRDLAWLAGGQSDLGKQGVPASSPGLVTVAQLVPRLASESQVVGTRIPRVVHSGLS